MRENGVADWTELMLFFRLAVMWYVTPGVKMTIKRLLYSPELYAGQGVVDRYESLKCATI